MNMREANELKVGDVIYTAITNSYSRHAEVSVRKEKVIQCGTISVTVENTLTRQRHQRTRNELGRPFGRYELSRKAALQRLRRDVLQEVGRNVKLVEAGLRMGERILKMEVAADE